MKNKGLNLFLRVAKICDSFLALCLLPCLGAFLLPAQSLSSLLGGSSTNQPSSAQTDPLNRLTPRSAALNFLEACHQERFVLASRYLDLRRIPPDQRAVQGPELAKQLADILNREPRFEVERLSDNAQGNLSDGLTPDLETLITVNADDGPSAIRLQRVKQQNAEVWLVSEDSVMRIADLDALEGASPIEKRLPRFLGRIKILGTPLWVLLALAGIVVLLLLLSRLLSLLFLALLKPIAKHYAKSLQSYRLDVLIGPLRVLIPIVVFRALMELVTPSALLRDYLIKLLVLLFTLNVAVLVMRIIDISAIQVQSAMGTSERALSYSVLPLGARLIKILLWSMAALFVLASWGYNTNALLAGLGVGGLAIALAAQKTIENLFGGIALITDRPVLVGDFCRFATQTGTVEDIGLRSTRIRTLDRTLVTIPNANFSTMTIENYSRRDRMWFHPTLRLRRDTPATKVTEMMDAILAMLQDHPLVQPGDVPLRLTAITDYSLDLEIFAYVTTSDFNEYLKVQTALFLQFAEAGRKLGVGFAVPVAESVTIIPPVSDPLADSNSRPAAKPLAEPQPPD